MTAPVPGFTVTESRSRFELHDANGVYFAAVLKNDYTDGGLQLPPGTPERVHLVAAAPQFRALLKEARNHIIAAAARVDYYGNDELVTRIDALFAQARGDA